jgi:probable rRNA maturation factor
MTRRRRRPSHGSAASAQRHKPGVTIELANHQRAHRVATARLRSAVRRVLVHEGIRDGHIDLALVDDRTIRSVHREFLNLDTPTDVLTFPLHEAGEPLSGQIVVSVETALREARRRGLSVADEVLLYVIHGVLHLCGYDDHMPGDARRMRRRQQHFLRQCQPGKKVTVAR